MGLSFCFRIWWLGRGRGGGGRIFMRGGGLVGKGSWIAEGEGGNG